MEHGDIASWSSTRYVLVLEGLLATPSYTGRLKKKLRPAAEWDWQILSIKHIIDYVTRGNVAVEIVTFMSEEVSDAAAEWFQSYDVPVASVEYVDFNWFCQSLTWRPEVAYVVDSDPDRFQRYGQRGYAAQKGGAF